MAQTITRKGIAMERSLRDFARRTAARLDLPFGLAEAAMERMEREGGISLDEIYDPDSPKCRACTAMHDGECPLESLADSLSLSDILPTMGGNGPSSTTSIMVGVDHDGKPKIMGRKTGSIHVEIPIDEFPSAEAAEAVREVFLAMKAIKEGNERLEKLRAETTELREFVGPEPSRLKNTLWDKFPEFMGQNDIKIAQDDNDVFLLIVNDEEQECAVEADFGQAILDRQKKLNEARETINANDRLEGETTTMVDAKERVLPQLRNAAETLVQKALPKGERFLGLGEKKGEKLFIVIAREVDEKFEEIPAEMRKMITPFLEGKDLPPAMLEALGIQPAITEGGEKEKEA